MLSRTNLFKLIGTTILSAGIMAGATEAVASSHREAPGITSTPKVDGTDFYMFNSYESGRAGYVTLIANYIPLEDPFGGPNYFPLDPKATYNINIDNVGDGQPHIIFQFTFQDALPNNGAGLSVPVGGKNVGVPLVNIGSVGPNDTSNLNFLQTFQVKVFQGSNLAFANFPPSQNLGSPVTDAATNSTTFTKPLDNIGTKTFSDAGGYAAYANQYIRSVNIPGCTAGQGRVFVGQRAEAFAVNLGKTFDLVNYVPINATSGFPGGITRSYANNTLANKNVTSLALEVPASCLTGTIDNKTHNGVIGGWTTASLPQSYTLGASSAFTPTVANEAQTAGFPQQISRLGMPLVNELVIGLKDKDLFNTSQPINDAQFLTYVTNPSLPTLLSALFLAPVNSTLGTNYPTLAPTNFPRNDLIATFLTGLQGINKLATVTPSEMLRLNTTIAATPAASQQQYGVIAGDSAGFPNGRRPADDVVDVTLQVAMGKLCTLNLGLCNPSDANVGSVPFTDGASPLLATQFKPGFPYLNDPYAGSSY